ncbi:14091_t:CDS:2 [Racocetra fulgida]|uniref:14091_t:CDS:1 n=1 Tax=Racocetra fulgida TaxID=60492 RepID=A0A9N9B3T1_9GLOM|nr:14091_t:CDS:2 [Racocetra fulgida]
MPFVSVKVVLSDRKEILNWQIYPVIGNPSLYEFFRLLATGKISPEVFINNNYHDFVLKAKVGISLKDEFVNINIQYNLNEILQIFGNFVLFELLIPEDYQPLIQKEKDVFKELINNGGGWNGRLAAESTEKSFINDLLNVIWYIDTCGIEKMKVRAIHSPKEFEKFFNRSDPSSYKNARLQFDYDCVNRYANLLFGYLNMPWIKNLNLLEISVRSLDDSISVKVYNGISFFSNPQTKSDYDSLNNKLSTLSYWEALDIEPFISSEPR